jgi:hypothetical protein
MPILVIIGVAMCCGLCAYAIARAVHRPRERRVHNAEAPTDL